MPATHFRTCTLCEAMCGIRIETDGDAVVSIKGDDQDSFSKGFICPKAIALQDLQQDPDRLRQPVRRTASGWEKISWEAAYDEVAKRLNRISDQHGSKALGVYLGNPNVHNHGNILFSLPLLRALKTRKRFSATSLDQLPHMLANLKMFGHQAMFPVSDIDRTDLFICIGGNPAASNGSLMTAPGMPHRLKAITARGGRVVTIDPRRTETSALASEHIFIKPGTDVLFLLAMLNVIFEEGLDNSGHLKKHIEDLDLVKLACHSYTPEVVEGPTGVHAHDIRKLAAEFANTPEAVLYSRIGTSVQAYGALCTWLVYCLNIVTGHFDRRGGMMFTLPAVDMVAFGAMAGQSGHFDKYKSVVRALPEFGGELPSSTMAEEIMDAGDKRIRAMVMIAGNPVLSSPNGQQLDKALASLDFMVSIDMYVTETSRHADIILPPTGPLERSHIDVVFPMVAVRNIVKYAGPVFEPAEGSQHDWEIFLNLARRLESRDVASSVMARARFELMHRLTPDGMVDLFLQLGPYGRLPPGSKLWGNAAGKLLDLLGKRTPLRKLLETGPLLRRNNNAEKNLSLNRLRNEPHGLDLGPLKPCLPERLYTKGKKIRLAPRLYLQDLPRVADLLKSYESHAREPLDNSFLLIGRRHVRSNNSWMHNSYRLVKGKNRCTAMIHPEDAERLGVEDGQSVTVTSAVGRVDIPAEVTDTIMPGVISIPHGWGHARSGISQKTAQAHAGVSVNDLTDEMQVDPLCGTAVLNAVPVTLMPTDKRRVKAA
ncbi:molybdopterin oxidoreductase family protein [Allohahella marinimesophila]|uniref:Molybdopterin oxidoreductase family protein n=1 Tax=Allohahella marinimesophila TaxID=1054972 RepID=A0ABP7P954_9GAMM